MHKPLRYIKIFSTFNNGHIESISTTLMLIFKLQMNTNDLKFYSMNICLGLQHLTIAKGVKSTMLITWWLRWTFFNFSTQFHVMVMCIHYSMKIFILRGFFNKNTLSLDKHHFKLIHSETQTYVKLFLQKVYQIKTEKNSLSMPWSEWRGHFKEFAYVFAWCSM